MAYSIENLVPVNRDEQGNTKPSGNWSYENLVPVNADHQGKTSFDKFRSQETAPENQSASEVSQSGENGEGQVKQNKDQSTGISPAGKPYKTVIGPTRPPESWLNATVHIAEGATWSSFVKPFSKPDPDMDQYLADLEKAHPIAHIIGGTAPFIVSAPFITEAMVPNLALRIPAQFGLVGLGQGINRARAEKQGTSIYQKASDVSEETLKNMAYGVPFAKAQALKILDRPFVSALVRFGIISGGTSVLSAVFGENIVEALKQGGIYGVLSLITETPHLATTALGRGIIAHANDVYARTAVKAGLPKIEIDPDSPKSQNKRMMLQKV